MTSGSKAHPVPATCTMESPPFHLDMGAARSSVCTELTIMPRPLAKSLQDSIDSNFPIDEGFHSGGEDEDMRRLFCHILPEVSTAVIALIITSRNCTN